MKNNNLKLKKIIGLSVLVVLSSCGLVSPNFAKRHKNTNDVNLYSPIKGNPQSFVKAELNTYTAVEATPLKYNVLSLTDRGQESYIKSAQAIAVTQSQTFTKLINTNFNFSAPEASSVKYIGKTVKKSLVFTIDRRDSYDQGGVTIFNHPGDRIQALEIVVMPSNGVKLKNWDKFVSDVLTLNLGSVSSAKGWNAEVSANGKLGGEIALNSSDGTSGSTTTTNENIVLADSNTGSTGSGVKNTTELGARAKVGYNESYNSSLDLSTRVLKLSGTFRDDSMVLKQESGPGIDLSGNVIVSVDFELQDDWATPAAFLKLKKLYYSTGIPVSTDSLKAATGMVFFPDIKTDITATLDYNFIYRQVIKGSRHIPEARQKIKNLKGDVKFTANENYLKKTLILIKKDDIRPKAFVLKENSLSIRLNGADLNFESMKEAAEFVQYLVDLRDNRKSFTGITLSDHSAFTVASIPGIRIITTQL